MSPASRRIFLYWLLLLVPTLAVGGGAILLLQREQARLAERAAYADEARRAAVAARARLVVENVELLVGDVEAGLLDILAAEPAAAIDAFLTNLEKTNPLVRTAFRSSATGQVLRPDARSADEDARGFLRRFSRQFGQQPPWSTASTSPAGAKEKREADLVSQESPERQNVSKNVAQMQNARLAVQELFKNSSSLVANDADARPLQLADYARTRVAEAETKPAEVTTGSVSTKVARAPKRAETAPPSSSFASSAPQAGPMLAAPSAAVVGGALRVAPTPDRRGWIPVRIDGRLHLFGWIQLGGVGEVRGVELELTELIRRVGDALPAEIGSGEGYALRDDQGRVLHQAGAVPRDGAPIVRVPFAATLLPEWDVVAYLTGGPIASGNGAAFLWFSVLLVGLLVAAILSGGSLLLRHARRSEEEAAQKTSFVANVSHEFKTPLTTIRLYSELLEQGRVRDQTQGRDYLRTIGRETQRLARLVNNALDFSRLEQGRKKYACETLDLGAELTRLLDTHAPRIADAGMTLQRDLPATPVNVTADRDALEQIVLNLLDNACKYAADGREIRVGVRACAGGGGEVRVGDRGPGVPPEHRERIFEKFHRVDDALTAEKTGAGLGLSIARQLARGLGGELRHEPRDGGGAEFVLELR